MDIIITSVVAIILSKFLTGIIAVYLRKSILGQNAHAKFISRAENDHSGIIREEYYHKPNHKINVLPCSHFEFKPILAVDYLVLTSTI
jgi:hypothetical protein